MSKVHRGVLGRWISAWLDRRGLGTVANVIDAGSAQAGDIASMHAMARRAMAARQWAHAEAVLRQALELDPGDASLSCSLGAALRWQGKFAEAREAYQDALRLRPEYLEVFINLGEWCIAQRQLEDAIEWLDRALALSPRSFEARLNKIAALFEVGRLAEAMTQAESLVKDEPVRPEAWLNLGNVTLHSGKGRPALKHYFKALELRPGYAEASLNVASLLGSKEDLGNSIAYLEQRLVETGDTIQTLGLLANAYFAAGRIAESESCCHKILARQPDSVLALGALANCCSVGGDAVGAVKLYEQLLEHDPSQWAFASNILFESNNRNDLGREDIFSMHMRWGEKAQSQASAWSNFVTHDRTPGRKLRIGYVSGDFVNHPVGYLLRDILRHHNPELFSIHCFSMAIRREEVLPELRKAADSWEDIFLLSDDETAKLIADAKIDILIDLSGHTALHRLKVFAMKPAPVQVEWIGYFHSTGLRSMDYFITDPHTSPRGSEQLFTETPVHLPHTRFCYGPPPYAADVSPLPALRLGYITFGSFNRLSKMTDEVVAAWASVLQGVPGSRLVLKAAAFTEPVIIERISDRFAAHGVGAERLELRENSPHGEMLAQYGDIDIALDTFPFNGGMTTLEAAWMGVPVVTIAGNSVVSRQTASVLANMGLADELAFPGVDSYVKGAIQLAQDTTRLAQLRTEMRERMVKSPLRDAQQFTRDLESLLRRMWVAWCNGTHLPSDIDHER